MWFVAMDGFTGFKTATIGLFELEGEVTVPHAAVARRCRLVQANRTRRRWLARFRKPKATRAASLIRWLVPSVAALVTRVCRNASICGHHAATVVARRVSSGMSASAHQV